MTRSKKFIYNTIFSAVLQIVMMVSGIIVPRIMLIYYGSEINGLVTSINQLVIYFTLVEAGIGSAAIYSLYKPIANKDHTKINQILVASRNFYFKVGYLFSGLIVFAALVYPLFINVSSISNLDIGLLVIVIGFNGVLEFFTLAKYRALLTADQKTYVISIASIFQILLNTLIIFLLSYLGFSIIFVRFVAIISILLRTLFLIVYSKVKYKYINFNTEPDYSSLDKRWDALYLQILGIIHRGAPIIISTFVLTIYDVSIYSIYYLVIQGINSIFSIFTSGLSAGFGDMIIKQEMVKFKNAFLQFESVFYIMISIVYSITFFMYIPFINIYTSGADINYIFPKLALLMVINGYIYSLKTPYGMLVISRGLYKETRIQTTIQGLLIILLGTIFAYFFGLEGILIASIISNMYRVVDFIFFAPKNLTGFKINKSIYRLIINAVYFIVMLIIALYVNVNIYNLKDWVLVALTISISNIILNIIYNYLLDKNMMLSVKSRLKAWILLYIKKEN